MPTSKDKMNGHAPANSLGARLAQALIGTDEIVIGSSLPIPGGNEVVTADMRDVAKLVAGIRYLVKGWIPFGMLTELVAEPGAGKSAFALYGLVRPIITAGPWFNGKKGPSQPGNVLWADTENSTAITVQRIRDWGLPGDRIKVPFEDDPLRSMNLRNPDHIERFEYVINRYRTKLAVIDALRGAHDEDENSSRVAQVLQSIAAVAERTKAAILVVHHTRKLQVDEELSANSSRGSNAILAMVRSQIGIDRPDSSSKWCRVRVLKENLGIAPSPIGFLVTNRGLEFGTAPERKRKTTVKDLAEQFLREHMTQQTWYRASELIEDAGQHGISEDALHRAKTDLGIVKPEHLVKRKDGWYWRLP